MKNEELRQILYELDWIKILAEAIAIHPTSWAQDPVWEWRNASDTILWAVISALENKNVLESAQERNKRFAEELKYISTEKDLSCNGTTILCTDLDCQAHRKSQPTKEHK